MGCSDDDWAGGPIVAEVAEQRPRGRSWPLENTKLHSGSADLEASMSYPSVRGAMLSYLHFRVRRFEMCFPLLVRFV